MTRSMHITDTRRKNLLVLVDRYGSQAELARATGRASQSICNICNGIRPLGEAASRSIEKSLGLPLGWLDLPHEGSDFPSTTWQQLDPAARALVTTVMDFLRVHAEGSPQDEALLLSAYRVCSPEARAVVLAVAKSHAQIGGTHPNNSIKPKPLRGSAY